MEEVDGVEVEAVEGILGVGGGEDEAALGGEGLCYLDAVGAVHAYVEEDYVGLLFHDGLEARVGFAEGLQRYAALALAEVLDDE